MIVERSPTAGVTAGTSPLVPWLAYKHAFVEAGLIGLNVLAVAYLTRRLIPMADTSSAWEKIRSGNSVSPQAARQATP